MVIREFVTKNVSQMQVQTCRFGQKTSVFRTKNDQIELVLGKTYGTYLPCGFTHLTTAENDIHCDIVARSESCRPRID